MINKICNICKISFSSNKENRKYCSHKCYGKSLIGSKGFWFGKKRSREDIEKFKKAHKGKHAREKCNFWKGGKYISRGYIYILIPEHPYATRDGYVREHRLIIENSLGRYLDPKEVPHHINGIKNDNRIENLMLFKNHSEHMKYHKCIKKP